VRKEMGATNVNGFRGWHLCCGVVATLTIESIEGNGHENITGCLIAIVCSAIVI
jgi:hypothetical protein